MNASFQIISISLPAVITLFDTLHHRSSTRRPPAYVVRPAATSVSYAFILSLIRSFCSLPFDRSIVSSKANFPRKPSSASSFNFQHPLASLRSPSSCLLLLPRLPVTATLASVFQSIACLKAISTQDVCMALCHKKGLGTMHYTGCHRRNGPNFGRVFLMLNYTDITQNTYIQS